MKKNSVRYIMGIMVLLAFGKSTIAQPFQPGQWWNARLGTNPAYTGWMVEKWRAGGFLQVREYQDTLQQQTLSFSAEYKIDLLNTHKGYGLVLEREHPLSVGFGLMSEQRYSSHPWYPYRLTGVSASVLYGAWKESTLSVGVQPAFYEAAGYYPVSSATVSDFSDTTFFPGHSRYRKFTLNAGILIGIGKMDCWTDDLVHRFEAGMALQNMFMDFRTEMPDIHPGKQIRAHAGALIPINKSLGLIPRVQYMYEGQGLYQAGITSLYRRHFGIADRFRLGIQYRSTSHLSANAGFRMYGTSRSTMSVDVEISREFALGNPETNGWHRTAWEFSLILKPLLKCWSMDDCSGSYQYESY